MSERCCKGLDVLLGRERGRGVVEPGDRQIVGAVHPHTGAPSDAAVAMAQGATGGVASEVISKTYLVMHIDNPSGLVANAKGKGVAFFTNLLVPDFIEGEVYQNVADELKKQFKERGSTVSVDITMSPPNGKRSASDLPGGIFLGVLLSAAAFGLIKLAGSIHGRIVRAH